MRPPDIEIAVEAGDWPAKAALIALARRAVDAAVETLRESEAGTKVEFHQPFPLPGPPPQGGREEGAGEVSILFTDDAAMRVLNARWRGKDSATNVLSFPQASEAGPHNRLLGDIVLAAETVAREAALAEKPLEDHMSHLIIHGFLHLLGYDHEAETEAEEMEHLERAALERIAIPDPYAAAQRP